MKKNQFLQIILPFIIFLIMIVFGGYSLITSETIYLHQAGDIASIYLFFLIISPLFLTIIVLIISIILISRGSAFLNNLFPKLHYYTHRITSIIKNVMSNLAKPIIEIDSHFSIFSKSDPGKGKNE